MANHEPKAVIWDFDGTLVDSEPMWHEHELDILSRFGVTWSDEELAGHIGEPAWTTAQRIAAASGDRTTTEAVHAELHERICARFAAGEIPWLPGARELLAELHTQAVRCAMVTASNRQIMSVVASVLPEFEFIVDGDAVSAPKPDPEGYQQAISRLGLQPHEVIVIEDSVPGTQAANAAGAVVLAVPRLGKPEPAARRVLREGGLEGCTWQELCEIWRSQW